MPRPRKPSSLFRYFNSSPEVIRLVMMYVRFPLSLRNGEDLPFERGIDIRHETVSPGFERDHGGSIWACAWSFEECRSCHDRKNPGCPA